MAARPSPSPHHTMRVEQGDLVAVVRAGLQGARVDLADNIRSPSRCCWFHRAMLIVLANPAQV